MLMHSIEQPARAAELPSGQRGAAAEGERTRFAIILGGFSGRSGEDLQPGEAVFQMIAQANREALLNQRIAEDDLRLADEELASGRQGMQRGRHRAVMVARAELGMGSLAHVYTRSHAQSVAAQDKPVREPAAELTTRNTTQAAKANHKPAPVEAGRDAPDLRAISTKAAAPPANGGGRQTIAHGTPHPGSPAAPLSHAVPAPPRIPSPGGSAQGAASGAMRKPESDPVLAPRSSMPAGSRGAAGFGWRSDATPSHAGKTGVKGLPSGQFSKDLQSRTIDRVLQVLRANLGKRHSVIRMQLQPPELGRLRIDLRMEQEVLQLRIEADKAPVRDLLQQQANMLHAALQGKGLSIDRYEVVLADAQDQEGAGGDDPSHASAGETFDHDTSSDDARTFGQEAGESQAGEPQSEEAPPMAGNPAALDITV